MSIVGISLCAPTRFHEEALAQGVAAEHAEARPAILVRKGTKKALFASLPQ
jgi:hypothetical protein